MKFRIPFDRVNWVTSGFLMGTLFLCLTAVPWYLWTHGLNGFLIGLFLFYFVATGLSITLGYHRLFSHRSFQARLPVRVFTLVFGASAFEASVINWASDHRRHHKHTDDDDDPYDITKGFFHAHIGWLLFRLNAEPPIDNVADLEKDPLIMWQHRWCNWIAVVVSFAIPTLLGWIVGGPEMALGAFLIGGVARIVFVHHMTFFINSLCHTIGRQPYSARCSARDSAVMALFTFGEGYHNFHHEFQHDYRNGVKWWQWDPTKWAITMLNKLGLVSNLRTVSEEKILLAEMREAQRRILEGLDQKEHLIEEVPHANFTDLAQRLRQAADDLATRSDELAEAARRRIEISRHQIDEWREDVREALVLLRELHTLNPELAAVG